MISQAEEKRETALKLLQEQYRQEERASDRDFRREEADLSYRRQLGRDADAHERRRGLLRERSELKAAEKAAGQDESGLSPGDQRVLKTTIERHTSGKGSFEGEKTDWNAVAQRLRSVGREDLARYVESQEAPGSAGIDVSSPEYWEAQRMAENWVSKQAKWNRFDETDFADFGGNREEARQAKTMEFYAQLTGTGTENDPYQPATQAEFDALPSGAIFVNPADGKLYKKN